MSKQSDRGYKRSWKNLLINKRYQLQFTLFMVGLSTILIVGLGVWVMRVADETTTVSIASKRGTPCPKVPAITHVTEGDSGDPPPAVPMQLPEPGEPPPPPAPAVDDAADPEPPRRVTVQIDESQMTMLAPVPKLPPDFGQKVAERYKCEMKVASDIAQLRWGRQLILIVLIGTGLLLVMGLAVYGIKMTHKVAGPLFKVSLYLAKMRDGRFDKVWNLRKGDQLVDFYEHFKHAHAGVVKMQKEDIAKIEAVIAAAEAAGAGELPSVVELRALVARKEKSIE